MQTPSSSALLGLLFSASLASAADVSGTFSDFTPDGSYKLVGDTIFDYRWAGGAGDIDLNGHEFWSETGGGNRRILSGAITGAGNVKWSGGGVPQVCPSILSGEKPNTFKGTFTLTQGVLDLDKPEAVDAIPGDLVIGTKEKAMVNLLKANQINDASHVSLGGPELSSISLNGHDETFASLTIATHALIEFGKAPSSLTIGDSSTCKWDLTKTLTISGFKPGQDKLSIGKDNQGLSAAQLARVGFDTPDHLLYSAKIGTDGQLSPATEVKAINPQFTVSPAAALERAKLYEIPGLATLTGKSSPLKDGTTIAFFGDSITWQNGYISAIEQAIKEGEGTKGKSIKLINRGINGADAAGLIKGSKGGGYPGDTPQKPLAEIIASDKVNLAVIFIGINDIWFGKGTPADYEKSLRDMIAAARENKTTVVLTTVTVKGELPDGKNGDDPKIEIFSEVARKVAQETTTTFVDLRKAYVAYLQNNNAKLRIDGTLYTKPAGILTYDGVHPSPTGNTLLANLIADGILRALEKR